VTSSLAVYLAAGTFTPRNNPFGMTIANRELHRALALHGDFDRFTLVCQEEARRDQIMAHLALGEARPRSLIACRRGTPAADQALHGGALLRGGPDLSDLAWERRRGLGESAYSLIGVIHTLAPPEVRRRISSAAIAPAHPWDAQICTSPAVRSATETLYEAWEAYLAERFHGSPAPRPMLPVIPLGVDAPRFARLADRPQARDAVRARLGVDDDAVLVLWVGRLSFFEKAYPQPMFRALQEAAGQTGARVHFAMAGWFPNGEDDRALFREAADAYAPSVGVSFEDGNDPEVVGQLWAGADIFLSLVDNIQETFGLTPVEAMAAGLPVVVSDWDGYRFTVRHGQEGFLVPTLGGPLDGTGAALSRDHLLGIEAYQSFVGTVAQSTAVDVGAAARALAELIASPELRRRMGAAGRERVAEALDWPVVIGRIRDLLAELAAVRAASSAREPRGQDPSGLDPFADFAPFPTVSIGPLTRFAVRPGVTVADLAKAENVRLDRKAAYWRLPLNQAIRAFHLIATGQASDLAALLAEFPPERHGALQFTLVWMCKLGLLDWRA
jgi:D-inositol-3-phosphate glycosyltransferase